MEVEDANVVTLAWSQAGARRDANMSPDNSEWSAVVPLLDAGSPAGEGEVTLTVTATGPGGTTISRQSIAVTDCPAP